MTFLNVLKSKTPFLSMLLPRTKDERLIDPRLQTPHGGSPSSPHGFTQLILFQYQLLCHLLYRSINTVPGSADLQDASAIRSHIFLAFITLWTITFFPSDFHTSMSPFHLASYSGSEGSGKTRGQSPSFSTASIKLSEIHTER